MNLIFTSAQRFFVQTIDDTMMRKFALLALLSSVMLLSCKKAVQETPAIPIRIATSVTRVTDTAFETDDAVGLFVVNTPAALKQSGNHADNVKFSFNGENWETAKQLYWLDDKTSADFYTYYPYNSSASIGSHGFSVQKDQSTEAGYKASEFLCGSNKDIAPTPDPVHVSTKHVMSCIKIELKAGTGWTDSDINAATVRLTGLQTAARINLADCSVTADGSVADISPLSLEGGVYKALVVPQSVNDSELIKVKVGNNDYALKTSVTLSSGKQHKCTLVVNRTSEGINIGIDPWEDGDDFGGTVE